MPDWLYHYTDREFAHQVRLDLARSGVVVAEIWDGLFGEGFYALDIGPAGDYSRGELRRECFGEARASHPLDGVLVLDAALAVPPFTCQRTHIWLMPGSAGTPVAIDHMIAGVGWWTSGRWELETYL